MSSTYREDHKKKISSSIESISSLINNLQVSEEDDHAEMEILHASVGLLMNTMTGRQLDLIGDLNSIVESLKTGQMTPEQLESVIRTEQDRSQYILNLSSIIGRHMAQLFEMVTVMLEKSSNGEPMSEESVQQMSNQMSLVSETVDSISKIIQAPAHKLQITIEEVETEIATAAGASSEGSAKANSTSKPKAGKKPAGAAPGKDKGKTKEKKSKALESDAAEEEEEEDDDGSSVMSVDRGAGASPDLMQSRKSPSKLAFGVNGSSAKSGVDFSCQVDLLESPQVLRMPDIYSPLASNLGIGLTAETTSIPKPLTPDAQEPPKQSKQGKNKTKSKTKSSSKPDKAEIATSKGDIAQLPPSRAALPATTSFTTSSSASGATTSKPTAAGALSTGDSAAVLNIGRASDGSIGSVGPTAVSSDSKSSSKSNTSPNSKLLSTEGTKPIPFTAMSGDGASSQRMNLQENMPPSGLSRDPSTRSDALGSIFEDEAEEGTLTESVLNGEEGSSVVSANADSLGEENAQSGPFVSKLTPENLDLLDLEGKVDFLRKYALELEHLLQQQWHQRVFGGSGEDQSRGSKSGEGSRGGVMRRNVPRGIIHSSGSGTGSAGIAGVDRNISELTSGDIEFQQFTASAEESPAGVLSEGNLENKASNSSSENVKNALEIGGGAFTSLKVLAQNPKYHPSNSHIQVRTVIPRVPMKKLVRMRSGEILEPSMMSPTNLVLSEEAEAEEEKSASLVLADDRSEVTIEAIVNNISVGSLSRKMMPALAKISSMKALSNKNQKKKAGLGQESNLMFFSHSWSKADKQTSTEDLNDDATTQAATSRMQAPVSSESQETNRHSSRPRSGKLTNLRPTSFADSESSFNCSPERIEELSDLNKAASPFLVPIEAKSTELDEREGGNPLAKNKENSTVEAVPSSNFVDKNTSSSIDKPAVNVSVSPKSPKVNSWKSQVDSPHSGQDLKPRPEEQIDPKSSVDSKSRNEVSKLVFNSNMATGRPGSPISDSLEGLLTTRPCPTIPIQHTGIPFDGPSAPQSQVGGSVSIENRRSLHDEIRVAPNPLLAIYNEFRDCIPDVARTRLLCAFFGDDFHARAPSPVARARPRKGGRQSPELNASIASFMSISMSSMHEVAKDDGATATAVATATAASVPKNIPAAESKPIKPIPSLLCLRHYFSECFPALTSLNVTASRAIKEVGTCEHMLQILLTLVNDEVTPDNILGKSVEALFKKMGEIKASKFFVEVQLGEYRSVFESLSALSGNVLHNLMQGCEDYPSSMKTFYSCQGKIVEIGQRLGIIKEHLEKAHLPSTAQMRSSVRGSVSSSSRPPAEELSSSDGATHYKQFLRRPSLDGISITSSELNSLPRDITKLTQMVVRSQRELNDAKEELEELSSELFISMMERDTTPGAIGFYSVMHDPATIITLEQLFSQLMRLKGFSDCTEHLDFPSVRKRLKECMSGVPTLERFITRYHALHEKWVKQRYSMFTDRKQTGGSADGSFTCPICCTDVRVEKPIVPEVKKKRLNRGAMVGDEVVKQSKPPTRKSRRAKEQIFGPTAANAALALPRLMVDATTSVTSLPVSLDDNSSFGSPLSVQEGTSYYEYTSSLPRLRN